MWKSPPLSRAVAVALLTAALSCDSPTSSEREPRRPAALHVVDGNDQEAQVGAELPRPLVARVVDEDGAPVAGQLVNFRVVSGGGSMFAGSGLTTDAGLVQDRWTLGTSTTERHRVEARAVDPQSGEPIVFAVFEATALPGPAAAIRKASEDPQTATVGGLVPLPPAVRVEDTHGNGVPGVQVTFQAATGGGQVTGGNQATAGDGVATVGGWTLGPVAGENTLTAAAGGSLTVTFSAQGTPAAAARLAMATEPSASARSGFGFAEQPAVRLQDAHGNAVATAGITVEAAIASGGGTLGGTRTAMTGDDGIARFTDLSISGEGGPRVLEFTSAGLAPVRSREIVIGGGAPANLQKHAGDGQRGIVGQPVAIPPAVLVTDSHGNPVPGASVHFEVTLGGGTVGASPVPTDANGIATVGSWVLGPPPGSQRLRASVSGVAAVTFVVTAEVGPASRLWKWEGDSQSVRLGEPVPVAPALKVVNQFNSAVSGVTVTFSVIEGGGTITDSVQVSGADGMVRLGSWRVGPTSGRNQVRAVAEGLQPVEFTAWAVPHMSLAIREPAQHRALVHGELAVEARVTSGQPLAEVRAQLANQSIALVLDASSGSWRGSIPLANAPKGQLDLRVVARDVVGDSATGTRVVVHDEPHTLTVVSPLNHSVARPQLRFDVRCHDPEGTCLVRIVAHGSETVVTQSQGSLNTDISLSAFEGQERIFRIEAYDGVGRLLSEPRIVHIESSTNLREVYSAPGRIANAELDRAIILADGSRLPRLYDVGSGAVTVISNEIGLEHDTAAYLTPRGAIFRTNSRLYEFRDGQLTDLGPASTLLVKHRFALYNVYPGAFRPEPLYRRDLETGTTTLVSSDVLSGHMDVTREGDVVFAVPGYQIHRWSNGATTALTNTVRDLWNVDPVSDSENTVFLRTTPCCTNQAYQIVHTGPAGEELLTPMAPGRPSAHWQYEVRGGWTAFVTREALGDRIWTRSPAGEVRDASGLQPPGRSIATLGPGGGVTWYRRFENGRWLDLMLSVPDQSAAPIYISRTGRPMWIGDRLFVVLGRTLFEVVP